MNIGFRYTIKPDIDFSSIFDFSVSTNLSCPSIEFFFMKNLYFCCNLFYSVDGKWGPWSEYSACSKECGGGIRKRTRTCIPPKFGGKPCGGSAVNSQPCNEKPCPGEKIL